MKILLTKNRSMHLFFLLTVACLSCLEIYAAPYRGASRNFKQPDGTPVPVLLWGDEFYGHIESPEGYTLVRGDGKGWICYAVFNEDSTELTASEVKYWSDLQTDIEGTSFSVSDFQKHLEIDKELIEEKRDQKKKLMKPKLRGFSDVPGQLDRTGSITGVTILIDFSDDTATMDKSEIENMLNQEGYSDYDNNGSVRDYYYDVSGGQMEYTNTVTEYYRASKTKAYYDSGYPQELVEEAVEWLDDEGFDFSTLTNEDGYILGLNIMFAGADGSNGLWSHQWCTSSPYTTSSGLKAYMYQMSYIGDELSIGVFCHESGHLLFYYNDLYDYDYDSYGVGDFCLMAYGCYEKNPVLINPYYRYLAGWEEPTSLNDLTEGITCTIESNTNKSYWYFNEDDDNEYFIIDSKLQSDRNAYLSGSGLAIWHVDVDGVNDYQAMTSSSHYEVSLEQADGDFDLENYSNYGEQEDLFYSGNKTDFSDETTPDANWWDGSESGLVISEISATGETMTFKYGTGDVTTYYLTASADANGSVSPTTGSYAEGDSATVTATADDGYVFDYWEVDGVDSGSDNPLELVMDNDKTVVAYFEAEVTYTLTIDTVGSGTVTPSSGEYVGGSTQTLTATADNGYEFTGWSGDITSTENPLEITMNKDYNITATFEAVPTYTVTITIEGNGSVSPSSDDYNQNSTQTFTATADDGYEFSGWSGDVSGTETSIDVTISSDMSIIATFIEEQVTTLTYNVYMDPMSDYTSTSVSLDEDAIEEALGMTASEIYSGLGSTVIYYGVEPDGSYNATSTANEPGHWFSDDGSTTSWGSDSYVFSELDLSSMVASIGQYPDACSDGDIITIKQALVSDEGTVILIFNIGIGDIVLDDSQDIDLTVGWNLVSTYITADDMSIAAIFPNATAVKTLEDYYYENQDAYLNTITEIEAGTGYLLYNTVAETITITGTELSTANYQFSISDGLNLIGCPYSESTTFETAFDSESDNIQLIESYDGEWTATGTQTIDSLEPGKAYFITK